MPRAPQKEYEEVINLDKMSIKEVEQTLGLKALGMEIQNKYACFTMVGGGNPVVVKIKRGK